MESLWKASCLYIRKLSVGACSVVIGISALGPGPGKKSQPSKVSRLRWRHPRQTETQKRKFLKLQGFSPGCHHPYQSWGKASLKTKASPFQFHLSVVQERKQQLLQIKIVAEGHVQDRERDFFNKDWYFKLNAAPGAEGRQVMSRIGKIRSSLMTGLFFDFDHNSAQMKGDN